MLPNEIDKATYDGYSADLREHYKEGSDGKYTLDHDGREKAKRLLDTKDGKLTEKDNEIAALRKRLEALGDADPEKAREALAELEELKRKELVEKGDVEAALAAQTAEHEKALKKLQESFDSEREFTSQTLINNVLRRELTNGRDAEGKPLPQVASGLVDGAEALIFRKFEPRVVVDKDGTRKAVVKVNGIDRDLTDWLQKDWLPSDAAKDWVQAPSNVGGQDDGKPATKVAEGGTILASDTAAVSANMARIASGEVTVVDG